MIKKRKNQTANQIRPRVKASPFNSLSATLCSSRALVCYLTRLCWPLKKQHIADTGPSFQNSTLLNTFNSSFLHIIFPPISTLHYKGTKCWTLLSTPPFNTIALGLKLFFSCLVTFYYFLLS